MPLPVVLVLLVAAILTVVALAWTVRALLGRLRTLGADLDHLQRDLVPALEHLQQGSDVTRNELDGLGDRVDRLTGARTDRPRRRWRPPHR